MSKDKYDLVSIATWINQEEVWEYPEIPIYATTDT